jgi:hypothetical protein
VIGELTDYKPYCLVSYSGAIKFSYFPHMMTELNLFIEKSQREQIIIAFGYYLGHLE